MSPENFSIEVDSRFLENFFGLAGMQPPANVQLSDLNNVLNQIKTKISNLSLSSAKGGGFENSSLSPNVDKDNANRPRTVLIVDDLGIITYQLEVLFKKMGFEVVISQEIYDAIDKYKKQDFGYAVIDLFIPTEREGFTLLDELKKLALLCKLNTKIIVMTASAKSEYRSKCLNRGADFYIEKSSGWQKAIMEACMTEKAATDGQ